MGGSSTVSCFKAVLVLGNVIIGLAGLALTAECIYFVSDPDSIRPLLEALPNTDLFAAAWIGIFTGFAFFAVSILGIIGIIKVHRRMLMAYIILMFIVFCFETASAITAATHRDYFSTNLFLQQMLNSYMNSNTNNSDDQKAKVSGVTSAWNSIMTAKQCCGMNGPQDWQIYDSAFRMYNPDPTYPWPYKCCNPAVTNVSGCKLGAPGYLYIAGCSTGILGALNRLAFAVAWFGFAILCWTFFVLLGTMLFWVRIEY
ncbi:uroplakin-1b-like [Hyperolius riggenbachi]|uniref:uroplakin-1b-like n=1 Tax=Hyperolius riggenbachi TaxID=752182 RepID=UPI0035A36D3B